MKARLLALACLGISTSALAFWEREQFDAVCAEHKDLALAAEARPSADDRARYADAKSCPFMGYTFLMSGDSEELSDARRCWLATDSEPLGLAFVFANGWGGVTADYDAATHFLCLVNLEDMPIAPAELWGMTEYVQQMRDKDAPEPLRYCPHVTSGRGGLFCESIEAEDHEQDQQRRLELVERSLDDAVRGKLNALKATADVFADKESNMREYESRLGTAHAAMTLAAETALKDEFIVMLEHMSGTRAAAVSDQQAKRVDAALNASYKKLLATPEACPDCSGAHDLPEVRRAAQRAWLRYRDAFATFYAERWKQAAPAAALQRECVAALARERINAMEKLAASD
jgi:uncharacterized protein YecT (DUF1311 family)